MGRTTINAVFTKEDWEKYNEYAKMVKRDLEVSKLPKDRQEEIFNVLAYNEQMRMAANRIGAERNAVIEKQKEAVARYKKEPNDYKAKQIEEEFIKLKEQSAKLNEERNYFLQKFHGTSSRAVALDNEMNEALIKQGYKIGKDGRPRKGEGWRQSATAKIRTSTKTSSTKPKMM